MLAVVSLCTWSAAMLQIYSAKTKYINTGMSITMQKQFQEL